MRGAVTRALSMTGTGLALVLLSPFLLVGVLLRLSNEVTTRVLGRAVTICPHCGALGVVKSSSPKVLQ